MISYAPRVCSLFIDCSFSAIKKRVTDEPTDKRTDQPTARQTLIFLSLGLVFVLQRFLQYLGLWFIYSVIFLCFENGDVV